MKIATLSFLGAIFFFTALPAYAIEKGIAIRIYDGDTITVKIGKKIEKVRLLGIDAPEISSKQKKGHCYGNESRFALRRFVLKKELSLKRGENEKNRDVYGRLLRYVFINEGKENINEKLTKEGFVYAYERSPLPVRQHYKKIEKTAQEEKRGLWSKTTCNGKRYEMSSKANNSEGLLGYH